MKYELYIGKHCHTITGPDGLSIHFIANDLAEAERVARLMFEAVDDEADAYDFHLNMGMEHIATELYEAKKEVDSLKSKLADRQAKIDMLMLEYCQDEMTPEQLEEWGKNQKPSQFTELELSALKAVGVLAERNAERGENMKTKFTPGPWNLCNTADIFTLLGAENSEGASSPSDDGWHIADCDMGSLSLSEVSANAQLIAAAPDLYENLLDRYEQTKCGCGHQACKRCADDRETDRVLARAAS